MYTLPGDIILYIAEFLNDSDTFKNYSLVNKCYNKIIHKYCFLEEVYHEHHIVSFLDENNIKKFKNLINYVSEGCYPNLINLSVSFDCNDIAFGFRNLKRLTCNDAMLMDIPPDLYNLEYLDCSNNEIEFIPQALVKLSYIDISDNPEIESLPDTLVNLKIVIARNLPYFEEIPDTFTKMEELICDGCKILETFPFAPSLKRLSIEDTNISKISRHILNDLEYFKGNYDLLFYSSMDKLTELTLSSEHPVFLKNIENIVKLDLEDVKVSNEKTFYFSELLTHLSFSNMSLIPESTVNLIYLDIKGATEVKTIPSNLVNLKVLDIEDTGITILPKTLVNLIKLVTDCTFIIKIPDEYTSLQFLSVSEICEYIPDYKYILHTCNYRLMNIKHKNILVKRYI